MNLAERVAGHAAYSAGLLARLLRPLENRLRNLIFLLWKFSPDKQFPRHRPSMEFFDSETHDAVPAKATHFLYRFREIVSDPVNLLIARVPLAGTVRNGMVTLHNGNVVHLTGPHAYYGDFSEILVINRGVHEPLEEFVFQEVLGRLRTTRPVMLELGAYWAHFSMWLKKAHRRATTIMVEPDVANLEAGRANFSINGYEGLFINQPVSERGFSVDAFMNERGIDSVDILHSDIQGFEIEMLRGAARALEGKSIRYLFVSTHNQELHLQVVRILDGLGYRVEVSSDVDSHSTSCDGLVFASSPDAEPIFPDRRFIGRLEICQATPLQLLQSLNGIAGNAAERARASPTAGAIQ